MASGLPRHESNEDSDATPPPPDDPTGFAEDEKSSDGAKHVPPPPPISASSQSNQSNSGSANINGINMSRIQTPPSHVGEENLRFGGSTSGLPKVNANDIQNRLNHSSQSSFDNDKILSSSNPLAKGGGNGVLAAMSPLDEIKDEALEAVEFTALLRQVDVGLEMTELLKEVVRKYSKHQNADATKLQEIYGKMKNVYSEMDGMHEFAEVCDLTHKLILETVQQQKLLAEYLGNELVPKLQQHLQEKQSAVQILKKENQQAEMKLSTSVTAMNKAEQNFKNAAKKARAVADPTPRKQTGQQKKGLQMLKNMKNKMKQGSTDMSEEEELYVKADQLSVTYEAAVMTANHAQEKHTQICRHFKYRLRAIEESRMSYCTQQMKVLAQKHKEMFESEEVSKLRNELVEKASKLDSTHDFETWVGKAIQYTPAKNKGASKFKQKSYDYENAFYSLEDALKVTKKLMAADAGKSVKIIPQKVAHISNVPLMMTVLCEKVKELDGFKEEGIFRVNASKNDLENLRKRLYNHNYEIHTNNAHLPAHMLKEWLRHLKDSLIPGTYYDVCIDMAKKGNIDPERLDVFISQLPEVNRDAIKYLVGFIKELLEPQNTKTSKMNAKNVAIVFAPTVLRCPSDDMQLMLTNSEHEQAFFIQLVEKLKI